MKVKNMEICYNLFLNASCRRNDEIRSNTWNITVVIRKDGLSKNADELYPKLESALDHYQNKVLNDVVPFDCIAPNLGNMCNYFTDRLGAVAESNGGVLTELRMLDSARTGVVVRVAEKN